MNESCTENIPYALSRKAFLDIVWNRFEIIEFRSTSLYAGQVIQLPKRRDCFGRVKVWLNINPDYSQVDQEQTLVHEVIHIDRQPWDRIQSPSIFSDEPDLGREKEESLTDEAATRFYEENRVLVRKARYHLWLRREKTS